MTRPRPKQRRADLVDNGNRNENAVRPGCECPSCKEWRMDLLIWSGDDLVACRSCGTIYDPRDGTVHAGGDSNGGRNDGSDA